VESCILSYSENHLMFKRYLIKTGTQINICIPVFMATFFSTAKTWKQPKCPSMEENGTKCDVDRQTDR
jgi:hypothetical protein